MHRLLFAILLATASHLFSQTPKDNATIQQTVQPQHVSTPTANKGTPSEFELAAGVSGGMTGGSGLSLQRWITPKHAIQINIFPFFTQRNYPEDNNGDYYGNSRDSGYSRRGMLSFGITYLQIIEELYDLKILAHGATSTFLLYEKENYYSGYSAEHTHTTDMDFNIYGGGGLGAAMVFGRFTVTALIGIVGSYEFTSGNPSVSPSIDGGVHFYMKRRKKTS